MCLLYMAVHCEGGVTKLGRRVMPGWARSHPTQIGQSAGPQPNAHSKLSISVQYMSPSHITAIRHSVLHLHQPTSSKAGNQWTCAQSALTSASADCLDIYGAGCVPGAQQALRRLCPRLRTGKVFDKDRKEGRSHLCQPPKADQVARYHRWSYPVLG